MALAIVATAVVALAACGSSSDATLDAEAILAAQTPCSMSAHSASSMGAVEKSCGVTSPSGNVIPGWACPRPEPSNTGYSLVFIGCNASFQGVYYDKSECVRDNATGLLWQGQTAGDDGLRDMYALKFNYTDEGPQQYVDRAIINGDVIYKKYIYATNETINNVNNTVGFVKAINATKLCGFSDWRLPTSKELASLRQPYPLPARNQAFFPRNSEFDDFEGRYWSSNIVGNSGLDYLGIALNMDEDVKYGEIASDAERFVSNRKDRGNQYSVRLVRRE